MKPSKILIGCEYSQVIASEFIRAGFDAYSCDLLPCEGQFPERHHTCNVLDILSHGWDMVIIHPPCTFLSFAGKKYWNQPGRIKGRIEALQFFFACYCAPVQLLCIENPLGIASQVIAPHSQIIHPYYFGDSHMKRTCLWLKNLPKLVHVPASDLFCQGTHVTKPEPIYTDYTGKRRYFTDAITGSKNGGHLRSKSFPGIAKAMVSQWGNLLVKL